MIVRELPSPVVKQAHAGYSGRFMTVIFNNDHNTMEEVIFAIMSATECPFEEAYTETWEAHHYGRASVHFDTQAACCAVAAMISRIGVSTEVAPEWEE